MSSPPQPMRERPGGYKRSPSGLVGALIVTVLAVLAFVVFRELTRENPETAAPSVDWEISLKAGRTDGVLQVLAPRSLPPKWRATSASYTPGEEPVWHLGLLTDEEKYVGIDESREDLEDLVAEHVDEETERGKDVTISGEAWQVFRDQGGDYALGRTIEQGGETESQLIAGSAPEATIRDFAASLEAGSVGLG